MNYPLFKETDTFGSMSQDFRQIAVVGLPPPRRTVPAQCDTYMQEAGYKIVPANPGHDSFFGGLFFLRLAALPVPP